MKSGILAFVGAAPRGPILTQVTWTRKNSRPAWRLGLQPEKTLLPVHEGHEGRAMCTACQLTLLLVTAYSLLHLL